MRESDNIGHRWASDVIVDPIEVEAMYDAEADDYEQQLNEWNYRVPEEGTEILLTYVPKTSKLLDAGCGTGLIGTSVYRRGYREIHGCDLSRAMLDGARSKRVYKGLVHANLCARLPYAEGAFDAVACLGTLGFIEDAEPVFREFCRVTCAGGVICFSQREDLFESRGCLEICRALEEERLWSREWHSDWRPYIPGHPAYTDRLRVGYFVYRAKTAGNPSAR